jgi:hypothetical protein
MKRQTYKNRNGVLILTLLLALPLAALAQDNHHSTQKNQSTANSNFVKTLALLELSMQQNIGKDAKAFGRAQGEYWDLIQSTNDFPRAYDFFSQLVAAHPSSPEALGLEGSAIGAYVGFIYSSELAQQVDEQFVANLDSKARADFEKALKLDSNNFTALFGYAIYESYRPGGSEHSKELFSRLEGLRSSHPEYPWHVVDEMKKERGGK